MIDCEINETRTEIFIVYFHNHMMSTRDLPAAPRPERILAGSLGHKAKISREFTPSLCDFTKRKPT